MSGSEKKQAGALGSMVRLRSTWMGWEKRDMYVCRLLQGSSTSGCFKKGPLYV